jgi:hypothetical protein
MLRGALFGRPVLLGGGAAVGVLERDGDMAVGHMLGPASLRGACLVGDDSEPRQQQDGGDGVQRAVEGKGGGDARGQVAGAQDEAAGDDQPARIGVDSARQRLTTGQGAPSCPWPRHSRTGVLWLPAAASATTRHSWDGRAERTDSTSRDDRILRHSTGTGTDRHGTAQPPPLRARGPSRNGLWSRWPPAAVASAYRNTKRAQTCKTYKTYKHTKTAAPRSAPLCSPCVLLRAFAAQMRGAATAGAAYGRCLPFPLPVGVQSHAS